MPRETDLKVFFIVIPKEGFVGLGPANPSLGMTPTIKYYSTTRAGSPINKDHIWTSVRVALGIPISKMLSW